jgi:hypothetical protein
MSKATLDLLKDIANHACAVVAECGMVQLVHGEGEKASIFLDVPEHYRMAALSMGYVWDHEASRWVQDGQAS